MVGQIYLQDNPLIERLLSSNTSSSVCSDIGKTTGLNNAGTGRSLVTETMMEQVLSGPLRFGGALRLLDKYARLGLAETPALNVPMRTLEQAARVWRFAMIQDYGNQDVTAVARVMQSSAGVEIRRRTKE